MTATLVSTTAGLSPAVTALRLSLHVLGASVWVGGQLVLAGLVPSARRIGPDAARVLANAFARLSWPAYALLLGTGVWNISTFNIGAQSAAWQVVLYLKIAVVLLAGLAALLHSRARSTLGLAVWGSVTALGSVAALVMGIFLAGP